MASEYNFPLLPAYRGSKAKNVMDVCACTIAVGIHRATLNIQGKDRREPLPGHSQLLPRPDNDVGACTQQGGAGKSLVLGLPPFQVLRGLI